MTERLVLFILLLVVSMATQAWFYVRVLQKAGRSGWWTATIYLAWLLGLVFIVVGGASLMMLVSGAVLMAVVPVAAIWLFAFVRWPLISTTEPTPTWKRLVATRDSSTDRWFEMAAAELESTNVDRAIWARALALADGGVPAARAKYIQFRVVDLAERERRKQAEKVENGNIVSEMAAEAGSNALKLTALSLVLLFILWILFRGNPLEGWFNTQTLNIRALADSERAVDAITLLDKFVADSKSQQPIELGIAGGMAK